MSQSLFLGDSKRSAELTEATVFFAGTTSVVLRYGGFTALVDPRFLHHGDHVHLGFDLDGSGIGASELARGIEELGPVDFAVVPQLQDARPGRVDRELDRRLPVLATPAAATTLRRKGFAAAKGLAAWETIPVARAEAAVLVTAMPTQRAASSESFLPDAMGCVLEFAGPDRAVRLRAFVSGDRMVHPDLREVPRRGIDVALLPVDGRRVVAVLAPSGDGTTAVRLVAPRVATPGPADHDDAAAPLERFAAAARRAGLDARVECVEPGARCSFTVPVRAARAETDRSVAA